MTQIQANGTPGNIQHVGKASQPSMPDEVVLTPTPPDSVRFSSLPVNEHEVGSFKGISEPCPSNQITRMKTTTLGGCHALVLVYEDENNIRRMTMTHFPDFGHEGQKDKLKALMAEHPASQCPGSLKEALIVVTRNRDNQISDAAHLEGFKEAVKDALGPDVTPRVETYIPARFLKKQPDRHQHTILTAQYNPRQAQPFSWTLENIYANGETRPAS